MRTKTLLGLAALAVGLSSSMAQVYSLNVVGYVNVPLQANKLSFLSVPLTPNGGNYNITNSMVLNDAQDGATIFAWTGTTWNPDAPTWFGGGVGWSPDMVIPSGTAFFISSKADSTLTFVGEVPQGAIAYNIPTGVSTLANKVPAATPFPGGTIGHDGDTMFVWSQSSQKWNNDSWGYFDGVGWSYSGTPAGSTNGPALNPGEGVFYVNSGAAIPFTQNFTVQ